MINSVFFVFNLLIFEWLSTLKTLIYDFFILNLIQLYLCTERTDKLNKMTSGSSTAELLQKNPQKKQNKKQKSWSLKVTTYDTCV